VKIRIRLGEASLVSMLEDAATAREFGSLLPLVLEFEDYVATEKIAYLPRKLNTTGAAPGTTPSAGDLCYYAPWGNIALFYRDFDYSPGLARLGIIDAEADAIRQFPAGRATVERIEE
jgi:hypothetical protein